MSVTSNNNCTTDADKIPISWKRLPSPIASGRWFAAAAVQRHEANNELMGILKVGGRNHKTGDAVPSVELLERSLCEWWNLPSLVTPRFGCAVAALKNAVYVMGGADSHSCALSTAEMWTFGSGQESWQPLPQEMSQRRWFCAAVGLERQGKVLVIGGRNQTWQPLNTVEAYVVQQQAWEMLHRLPTARFGCAAVLLGRSRIMVIGGCDGKNALDTCHVYNIEDDEWHNMPSMKIPLAFCSATVVNKDCRYVFVSGRTMEEDGGGSSGNNVIQCYSERTQKWTVLRTSESLEAGPLLSMGEELITIGGPQQGTTNGGEKAVCRRWNLSNVNLVNVCTQRSSSMSTAIADDDGYGNNSSSSNNNNNNSSQNLNRRVSIDERSLRSIEGDSFQRNPPRPGSFHTRNESNTSTIQTPVAIPVAVEVMRHQSVESEPQHAAALHAESVPSTISSSILPNQVSTSNDRREIRQVSDFPIEDVHGESAWYSGDLDSQTNKPHGKGRMRWDFSGEVYDGQWSEGHQHGLGLTHYTSTNEAHEGFYHGGKKHGTGRYTWPDGREYEGNYVNNLPEDKNGKLTWKDKRKYVGQFLKGERTGRGKMEFPNGDVYDGYFVNGRYEGFGVLKFHDGRVYEGEWKKNQANGNGTLRSHNGETLHEGWWENDRPARENTTGGHS